MAPYRARAKIIMEPIWVPLSLGKEYGALKPRDRSLMGLSVPKWALPVRELVRIHPRDFIAECLIGDCYL